ncbi:MAG: FHA domain-containing protein [Congregibacter sp.]
MQQHDSTYNGSFFSELRRRQVIRTCLLYVLLCWGVVQVAEILAPPLDFDSDVAIRVILVGSFVGFPIVALLAWFFKITGRGIERTNDFVERRILNNVPPINDRRHDGVGAYFAKGKEPPQFDWVLSVETGPLSGLSFGVADTLILGRALDCDLAIVTPHVSRQHARLSIEDTQLKVEDLGSSNGTIVNGKQIQALQALHHEDEIRLHDIVFRVTESFTRPNSERQSMNETTFINKSDIAE